MPVDIDLITPPRGRLGAVLVIDGTGFAAANNEVKLIEPDLTEHVQTIDTQSTTQITLDPLTGSVTENFQHTIQVENLDNNEIGFFYFFVPKSLVALETELVPSQQPGQFEALGTERPTIAEAKDYERLAALAEFARDKAGTADASKIQGIDVDPAAPTSGDVLEYDGIDYNPVPVNAREIQGTAVDATGPTVDGEVLAYNLANNEWEVRDPADLNDMTSLFQQTVDNTGTVTYTIPANTLENVGDWIEFNVWGAANGGGGLKAIDVEYEGNTVLSLTLAANEDYHAHGRILMTGASAQKLSGCGLGELGAQDIDNDTTAEDNGLAHDLDFIQTDGTIYGVIVKKGKAA